MIDIHNHLLCGVDDGAKGFKSALGLLKEARRDGIAKVILTPHFMKNGAYHLRAWELRERFAIFKEAVSKETDIELYLGNELYIDRELDDLLLEKAVLSLNDSRYVLVEFPFGEYRDEYDEYLYNLKTAGFKVIIAHPERYRYVRADKRFVERWTANGFYLQVNRGSFELNAARALIYDWLAKGYVYFIASDAHNLERRCKLAAVYERVAKRFGEDIAKRVLVENPQRVLDDEALDAMPVIRKKFLGLF